MRRPSWRLLRLALPVVLLASAMWAVDAGAAWTRLREADLGPLVLALACLQAVTLGSAVRWVDTTHRLGRPIPLGGAMCEYYVAALANQLLPGGMAGDALRVWRGRAHGGTGPVARGVVIERLAGQLALALVLLLGLGLGGTAGALGVSLVFAGGLGAVLVVLVAGHRLPGRAGRALAAFRPDLRLAWATGRAPLVQGALNLAITGALIGAFALCARAVGPPLTATEAMVLVPACLAAMLVPVGLGGLGLREGAAAVLWPLAGLAAEAGVATSILFGLTSVVAALPGIVFAARSHLRDRR